MSIIPMFKKCVRCKKRFTYNPSVGDFGKICPFCKWPQELKVDNKSADTEPEQS